MLDDFYRIGFTKYNHSHDPANGKFSSGGGFVNNGTYEAYGTQKDAASAIANREFSVISKVHDIPNTEYPLTVSMDNPKSSAFMAGANAGFLADKVSPSIHMDSKLVRPGDFTHEYGHFIDNLIGRQLIGPPADYPQPEWSYASNYFAYGDKHPVVNGVMQAIENSQTAQTISLLPFKSDKRIYMNSGPERFARAYFQYIATKSGDPAMLKTLHSKDPLYAGYQWPSAEFKPISNAFDKMFSDLGMLKVTKEVILKLDPGSVHTDGLLGSEKPVKQTRAGVVIRVRQKPAEIELQKYNHSHDPASGKFSSGLPVLDLAAEATAAWSHNPVAGPDGTLTLQRETGSILDGNKGVETIPLKNIYRAISLEDFNQAKARGYLQSDGRKNIISSEGTVATHRDPSSYLPGDMGVKGLIVRMNYNPADHWRVERDGYLKTNAKIPFSRLTAVSPLTIGTGTMGHLPLGDPKMNEFIAHGMFGELSNALPTSISRAGYGPMAEPLRALKDLTYNLARDKGGILSTVDRKPSGAEIASYANQIHSAMVKIGPFDGSEKLLTMLNAVTELTSSGVHKYNHNHDNKGQFSSGSGGILASELVGNTAADLSAKVDGLAGSSADHGFSGRAPKGSTVLTYGDTKVTVSGGTTAEQVAGTAIVKDAFDAIQHTQGVIGFKNVHVKIHSSSVTSGVGSAGITQAWYNPKVKGELNLSLADPTCLSMAVTHEFGHMLDFEKLKGNLTHAATQEPDTGPVGPVMRSMIRTKTIQQMMRGYLTRGSQTMPLNADQMAYYLTPPEAFARGYTQWVASTPGNTKMHDELKLYNSLAVGQWPASDFRPIATHFNSVFAAHGLRKVTKSVDPFYQTGFTKYNHNHDNKGKFSSGGGDGFTVPRQDSTAAQAWMEKHGNVTPQEIVDQSFLPPFTGAALSADTGAGSRAALQGYLDSNYATVANSLEVTPQTLKSGTVSGIKKYLSGAHVAMRVDRSALQNIVVNGQNFRNQFETGTSNGTLDHGLRKNVENTLFGIPKSAGATERPVYGFFSHHTYGLGVGNKTSPGPRQYGAIEVSFKPSVMKRATFTCGDSMSYDSILPSGAMKPDHYSIDPHMVEDYVFNAGGANRRISSSKISNAVNGGLMYKEGHYSYNEAQVHGGLRVSDISHVHFNDKIDPNHFAYQDLMQALDKHHIPWSSG